MRIFRLKRCIFTFSTIYLYHETPARHLALCATTIGFSQLPNGSVAPDFTITDIEGEEHNLYSYLDSGYAVIIDFSATWCGPCWNYHTSGVFEEIYQAHGPDGANDVRILFIESDDNTTDDDLHGTGTNTWGDWTAGIQYPIADNGGNIFDLYQCVLPHDFHGVPQPHHPTDRPGYR